MACLLEHILAVCYLIMAGGVAEALAEAGGEGGLAVCLVQVGGVAYGDSAEVGDTLAALLGVEGGNRGGGCHHVLPHRIG